MEEKSQNQKKNIIFRISEAQKEKWKKACAEKNISMTDFIISSVENRMTETERRKVLTFIEIQDNIFAKIENNINQFARIANSKKEVNAFELKAFTEKLADIQKLKSEQNQLIKEIYKLIANDS